MQGLSGFPKEGLEFLTTLGTKDKRWFDRNRDTYDSYVVSPAKAFVSAVGATLAERISPAIVAQVRWLRPLPKSIHSPSFVEWCAGQLVRASDIHRWLVSHLA